MRRPYPERKWVRNFFCVQTEVQKVWPPLSSSRRANSVAVVVGAEAVGPSTREGVHASTPPSHTIAGRGRSKCWSSYGRCMVCTARRLYSYFSHQHFPQPSTVSEFPSPLCVHSQFSDTCLALVTPIARTATFGIRTNSPHRECGHSAG